MTAPPGWTSLLNAGLVAQAQVLYTGELAWSPEAVEDVMTAATECGLFVVGGDVWHRGEGDPMPAHINWACERRSEETQDDYRSRCLDEASAFVRSSVDPSADLLVVPVCSTEAFVSTVPDPPR